MESLEATVILAVKDGADALPSWLVHIEQQTYPAADFEVLVADAGSTDGSSDLVERYAAGAPVRTRCLRFPGDNLSQARNAAAREARGRWLMFLDLDLVPSPKWLMRMVQAQQQSSAGLCAAAKMGRHPQVGAEVFTRWFLPELHQRISGDGSLHPLDCGAYNLCMPKEAFLRSEGFDPAPGVEECAGPILALRLEPQNLPRVLVNQASVYIWRPARLNNERQRHYALGHALYHFGQKTDFGPIQQRFWAAPNILLRYVDALTIPFYIRACEQTEEDVRIMGFPYRRVLRHDLRHGYYDASKGRPFQAQ